VFIFKFKDDIKESQLQEFIGLIRYYNGDINEENKHVSSFPLKTIVIDNDIYTFARIDIKSTNISKLDIFFMKKGTSKASKFYTIKELKLINNGIR
jgi:hypothetical protein